MKQSEQSVTLSRYFRKLLGLLSSLSGDKQSSQLLWALVLAVTIPAAAQISVTPQRIAGLEASAWPVGDGGPAVNALVGASSLAWDPADNLLIFDSWHNSIRKITPDGTISKVFDSPISGTSAAGPMRADSKGNLYFSQCETLNNRPSCGVSKVTPEGKLTVVPGFHSDGVVGLAFDAADNLYIAQNVPGYVWRITPDGAVQKIAGSGAGIFDGNSAPALSASLGGVQSLAFDGSGNLLMASWQWLWRLNPDGTVVPLAGVGQPDGFKDYIYFQTIAASQSGVFVVNGYQILRLDASGTLAVLAGIRGPGGYGVTAFSDGCALSGGSRVAIDASLYAGDITIDTKGRLYVADVNGRVRRIDPDGSIRTIAGTGMQPHESPSGTPALQAVLYSPYGVDAVAADALGNVYFTEPLANRVQEITASGLFVTVAGTDSPPPGDDAACYSSSGDVLSNPSGVAVDASGNVYISDTGNHRILRLSSAGAGARTLTTIAGTGVKGSAGNGGPAIAAQLWNPTEIHVDSQGQVYFLDILAGETSDAIRRIRTDGIIEAIKVPPGTERFLLDKDDSLIVTAPPGLYRQIAGQFYLVGDNLGIYTTVDPTGVLYGGGSRLSRNCHRDFIQGLPPAVSADPYGNLFFSTGSFIWRIPAIPPPANDTPSPYVDNPGIYNAASNLIFTHYVPPYPGPHCSFLCPGYTEVLNDSITGNEIVRIKGGCLGPLQASSGNLSSGQAPTTLSSTQALFDGALAPLLSVQSAEILVVAPQNVASKSQVQIVVANAGIQATSVTVPAAPAVPGIFALGNLAAAINQDDTINGADHPAPVGSIVSLFLTGAGANNPPLQDGAPPGAPVPLALPVTVLVGQTQAEVTYAGAAPGLLGVAQVNVVIPANAPAVASVQVSVGGISRSQVLSLIVQR